DVLHGVVGGALRAAGAEEAHDVRVAELLEDAGFALEAGQGGFITDEAEADDLEGHRLAVFGVTGAVDGAHGPAAQRFLDDERTKRLACLHGASPECNEGDPCSS